MPARRDTRIEAPKVRRFSPLQTVEDQSQTWGIRCHSCTGREGLPPSWKLSYKTYVLRFTREPRFSFNQRIARLLMSSGLRLTSPIDARRDISVVSDTSLRTVDAQHYVKCPSRNREPVGDGYTSWKTCGHVNRQRAVSVELQPCC